MRDIDHFAGTVHDDEDATSGVKKHQVVDDAARVVKQQTVTLLANRQVHHINRHQAFKRGGCVRSLKSQLAHVRDIKQASGSAGMQVLGHQSSRVLHRHAVASKWHHARAKFYMQVMQRGFKKRIEGRGQAILRGANMFRD